MFYSNLLQALSNNGANMNSKDYRGNTPAHLASAHGNSFTLHSILRSGIVSETYTYTIYIYILCVCNNNYTLYHLTNMLY